MMMRRAIPWTAWLLSIVMVGVGVALAIVNRSERIEVYGFRGAGSLLSLTFGSLGFLISRRRPENPIGWMFLGGGTFASVQFVGQELAVMPHSSLGRWGAWLDAWMWAPLIGTIITSVVLLFPNGRLLSPRWRPALWANVLAVTALTVPLAFSPGVGFADADIPNPLGVWLSESLVQTILGIAMPAFVTALALAALSLVLRFRRSRGTERIQMKWFAFAAALYPIGFVPQLFVALAGVEGGLTRLAEGFVVMSALFIPSSVAIAILRYRLFEIDRIIARTVVYSSVTLLLGSAYAGAVFGLGPLLRPVGAGSDLAIAASTLAVAAMFRPLRGRIQAFVDRRFNRRRYDAARTIEAFATRLRAEIDMDALGAELRSVIGRTMQPAHASVWLRPPGGP